YSVVSEVILDGTTGRAAGVRVIDANTREVMEFKARVVVLGAGTLDTTRILLNSKSSRHPEGLGNSSGRLGCHLSEHAMGPRGSELKMAKDMADTVEEMLAAAGAESIKVERELLPPGWSIHEIGTARMGDHPKQSVTDKFCRLHDVDNVYLDDASPFVSGGTQNTTWSILAMCWRTRDHLKEQLRSGGR